MLFAIIDRYIQYMDVCIMKLIIHI